MESLVTTLELCKALGIQRNTIARWRREGLAPTEGKRGRAFLWNPARVRGWCEANGKDLERLDPATRNGTAPERPIDAARRRREEALADKYELELAVQRNELVRRAEVVSGLIAKTTVLRSRLLNLVESLPSELVNEDVDVIRERIRQHFEQLCRDFGSGVDGIVPTAEDLAGAAALLGLKS